MFKWVKRLFNKNNYNRDLELLFQTNEALLASIQLMEARNKESFRNGMVMLACAISTCGGQIRVSKEIYELLSSADIQIHVEVDDNNYIWTLDFSEPTAEEEPEFVE